MNKFWNPKTCERDIKTGGKCEQQLSVNIYMNHSQIQPVSITWYHTSQQVNDVLLYVHMPLTK
jgi:hypothetical protein